MTQISYLWNNNGVGDGASYPMNTYTDLLSLLFTKNRTSQGVLFGYLNELAPSGVNTLTLSIATGGSMVEGKLHLSPDILTFTGAGPTTGLIVARMTVASGVVRIVSRASGALTQTAAVWEIPICEWTRDGGGNFTVINDARVFAVSPLLENFISGSESIHLIETIVPAGSASNITFDNIPTTFDHLLLIGSMRTQKAGVTEVAEIFDINSDGGANYSNTNIETLHGAYAEAEFQAQTKFDLGQMNAFAATSDHFTPISIWIPFYKDTNFYKTFLWEMGNIPNAVPAATWEQTSGGGIWENTAAIDEFTIGAPNGGGLLDISSLFSLYGIKS